MPLYKFAAKQPRKEHKLWVKEFPSKLTTSRDGPVKSTETRKGLKDKNTILLQESCGKKTLEDYSTSIA